MLALVYALISEAQVEISQYRSWYWQTWAKRVKGTCVVSAISIANQPLANRVAAHVVLDGAGADSAVTQALGSLRFQVTINGPGGHSFTDAGTPNPIAALAATLAVLGETPLPEEPRTTLNLGTVRGGTSVNSIPESAMASIDFRSTSAEELLRLEVTLHRLVEDAVERANAAAKALPAAVAVH